MNTLNVSMIGLGYIGLPTAALMASKSINVKGVDINKNVVEKINRGEIHIVEPGLESLVQEVVSAGYLKAATHVEHTETYLIAVPTPFKENLAPDLKYVIAAAEMISPVLQAGDLIIIESTSPVGTTAEVYDILCKLRPELENKFFMAYCPERVLPGNVLHELQNNDRVIGGINEESTLKAISFYQNFVKGQLHPTNAQTAELCKLVENSSRDVQIAFANELSMICDRANIDVWDLINLANKHPRVQILKPGTGVGGHCIAVDPWFIVSAFPKEAKIIRAAREINNFKTEWVIEKCKNAILEFELEHKRKPIIACLGLAFKPNIDDLRESPAVYVAQSLNESYPNVMVVEPNITEHNKFNLVSLNQALEAADIIISLVAHTEFKQIKPTQKTLDFCNYTN